MNMGAVPPGPMSGLVPEESRVRRTRTAAAPGQESLLPLAKYPQPQRDACCVARSFVVVGASSRLSKQLSTLANRIYLDCRLDYGPSIVARQANVNS